MSESGSLSDQFNHLHNILKHSIINYIWVFQDTSQNSGYQFDFIGSNFGDWADFFVQRVDDFGCNSDKVWELRSFELAERTLETEIANTSLVTK